MRRLSALLPLVLVLSEDWRRPAAEEPCLHAVGVGVRGFTIGNVLHTDDLGYTNFSVHVPEDLHDNPTLFIKAPEVLRL